MTATMHNQKIVAPDAMTTIKNSVDVDDDVVSGGGSAFGGGVGGVGGGGYCATATFCVGAVIAMTSAPNTSVRRDTCIVWSKASAADAAASVVYTISTFTTILPLVTSTLIHAASPKSS